MWCQRSPLVTRPVEQNPGSQTTSSVRLRHSWSPYPRLHKPVVLNRVKINSFNSSWNISSAKKAFLTVHKVRLNAWLPDIWTEKGSQLPWIEEVCLLREASKHRNSMHGERGWERRHPLGEACDSHRIPLFSGGGWTLSSRRALPVETQGSIQ